MVRTVLAIFAGYILTAVLVVLTTSVVAGIMVGTGPDAAPTPPYLVVNVLYSAAFAAVGGYVAARLGQRSPILHGIGLGFLMLVVGMLASLGPPPQPDMAQLARQPSWYGPLMTAIGPVFAVLGSAFRANQVAGAEAAPVRDSG